MSELKIYNTFTRSKEPFRPLHPGRVGMYVCGVTVYDYCHLGHGRCYTAFDAIRRYLEYLGYEVVHIQNITDVDDKLIRKASLEPGTGDIRAKIAAVAQRYTEAYFQDMDRLNVLRAREYPRATENIPAMIEMVSKLLADGIAYLRGGNVYFEVARFPSYGKLSGRDPGDLRAGARVEIDPEKKSPLDFALWKSSSPSEPAWDSPWGPGRPGWHIECSAMSTRFLGKTFDIHGGGQDLIFPHHENERAQSEAATGLPFARYWVHNGFVTIKAEKMSKSLGNVFNLRDIFSAHPPRVVRFFFLSQHYRSPVDFSEEGLREAAARLARLDGAYGAALERFGQEALNREAPDPAAVAEFEAAMNDDFNTAAALGAAFRAVNSLNQGSAGPGTASALMLTCRVLGIELVNPRRRVGDTAAGNAVEVDVLLARETLPEADILALAGERRRLRAAKDYAAADRIRARLAQLGVEVRDNPDGTATVVYH